jgi:protein-disulfide isomerase
MIIIVGIIIVVGAFATGIVPLGGSDDTKASDDSADAQTDTTPEQPTAAPVNDPAIGLTVVTDNTCPTCDPTRIINVIETNLFPTVEVIQIDISEEEGQDLIRQYNINAVPAFLFDARITEAHNYTEVSQILEANQDRYIIVPSAIGAVKLLTEPNIEGRPMKGDPDAPILMVEYSDFECPFCGRWIDETYPSIDENYIQTGQVKLVFKHFPLSFHQNALPAALASECAHEQGMFWEMHDIIFANQESLSTANLKQWAADIGLDTEQFNGCFDSQKYADQIQQDMAEGIEEGISGAPGFIINGVVISGALPYESFTEVFDGMLQG